MIPKILYEREGKEHKNDLKFISQIYKISF